VIELEPWQERIVAEYPGDFARGLFHSDGYRGINRVRRPLKDGPRWYGYLRYLFVNQSATFTGSAAKRWTGWEWRGGFPSRTRSR
jgi:hypothetical protein